MYAGAWRLLELSDEFDEFDEFDELDPLEVLEPELCEPELCEPEPRFAVPLPVPPLAGEELPVPVLADELPGVVAAWCVDPGSTAATTPAPTTLAKLTVAVAAVSRRRPRSRSATARDRSRALPCRRGCPYGDSPRGSELLIPSVLHTQMDGPYILPLRKLCSRRIPGFCLPRGAGIIDR